MAIPGGRDSRDIVVATGVDAAVLRNLTIQDGVTYEAIAAELNGAIIALNQSLLADPLYQGLVSVTDVPDVEYPMGAVSSMDRFTENAKGDAARASRDGHMLPFWQFDFNLSWTWNYMQGAYFRQIQDDIQNAVDAVLNQRRKSILTRLIKRADETGAANGLGSTGISAGFATAAANTGVDFTPPDFGGTAFDSNHEHYKFAATLTSANMVTLMKTLREHGIPAPYDLIVSDSDYDTVKAFTDFVPPGDPLVQYGTTTSLAVGSFQNGYGGYLKDSLARVRVVPGFPANYVSMFKSYGPLNPKNPLRIRVRKGQSTLAAKAFQDPRTGAPSPVAPFANMAVFLEFGVGVGNRLAAAAWRNNAAWADGTVS